MNELGEVAFNILRFERQGYAGLTVYFDPFFAAL
jgi:hypothetical protein